MVQRDRRSRRRERARWRRDPCLGLGGRIVLGRDQDLRRLLGHLAADRVDSAVEETGRVSPRAARRRARRSSSRAVSSQANPSPGATAGGAVGVEAAAGVRGDTSGRRGRRGRGSHRLAVEGRSPGPGARDRRRLALAPSRSASASGSGRPPLSRVPPGLLVHPGQHQDPAVGDVLDDHGASPFGPQSGSVRGRTSWVIGTPGVMPRPPRRAGPAGRRPPSPA